MLKHLIGKEDFEGIDRFFQAGLKFDPSEIRFAFRLRKYDVIEKVMQYVGEDYNYGLSILVNTGVDYDLIPFLIELGGDINKASIDFSEPMSVGFHKISDQYSVFEVLKNYGAEINHKDFNGISPFFRSFSVPLIDVRIHRYALENGGNPFDLINLSTYHLPIPFLFAAIQARLVKGDSLKLIAKYFDFNILDQYHRNALHFARDQETFDVLVELGVDPDQKCFCDDSEQVVLDKMHDCLPTQYGKTAKESFPAKQIPIARELGIVVWGN